MKKIVIIIGILFIILINYEKQDYLVNDSIRFRVISNSDSAKDVLIKQKVSRKISNIIFDKGNSKDDVRNNILKNISKIEKEVDQVLTDNDYDNEFNINYGYNYFPEKEYNGRTLEAGNYESLVVTIGKGDGNNYWCILYPPLCMINEDDSVSNKIKYKFKLIEYIKNIL